MSSPFRSSARSTSTPRTSPSRALANSTSRLNGYHRSAAAESPTRQLLEEFGRMLLHDSRVFNRSLDEQTAIQQKLHLEALDQALLKHEEVRVSAERTRERVELEIETERRRREEEERRAVEKARRELEEQRIEKERRQLEETRAREDELRKREQLKRDQDAERERQERAKREQEEATKQDQLRKQEEDARKAQIAAAPGHGTLPNGLGASATAPASSAPATQGQSNSSVPVPQPTVNNQPSTAQPASLSADSRPTTGLPKELFTDRAEREAVHKQYLALHQRLKKMRENVLEECKKIPGLKNQVSDWRRAIVKCCGQMGKGSSDEVKAANKRAIKEIMDHLDRASTVAEPSIDVTQYLVENRQPPGANTQGPAVLVFLLNYFAKGIIRQFISESSVDPKSADSIGVLAVTVFARPQYLFNGQSLIDLLWAKYHVHCPVLFGINGSERSREGRTRLGWALDPSTNGFARDQLHYDRMTGLSVGFAAITLRDFSKSQNSNPAPNRIFWQALARILNTPANQTQPTHFIVVKAMIEQYVPRIIALFGGAGIAVLRQALIAFPQEKGPQDDKGRKIAAVTAVQAMPMVLQRDLHLTL